MPLFKYRRALPRRKPSIARPACKPMRDELTRLVDTVASPAPRKAFDAEMQSFYQLFSRYLAEKASSGDKLDWSRVKSAEGVVSYDTITKLVDDSALAKLAVLKVNGGLGTSMGMTGAKSALEVRDELSFLDLTVQQIAHLNTTHAVDVPLLLMTSFNTHADTLRIIKKYTGTSVRITTFNQSRYPRILKDSLLPCPQSAEDANSAWYPPGHGDLYNALQHSGLLDQLLAESKEYLFVSNSDNLGAVVDQRILQHMIDTGAEFIMEVTDKTKADVKGGTLVDYNGSIRLLEIAQVPPEHVDEFKSVRKFKIFNTNNLWIDLKALKRILSSPSSLPLDIIVNPKLTDAGQSVIQLETAAGSAVQHFPPSRAFGINVPRQRFLPVKNCSDLLLVRSDVYSVRDGALVPNPQRMFTATPVIQLGDHFRKVHQFLKRFKSIPSMIDLDLLTVAGDVTFGRDIVLRGTVIVLANDGQRVHIPDGAVLENRLVNGNLTVIEL
ncbi:UTP--glucose-1-phosphate uridylyltransferase [Mycena kentingensis (nom. inval.)]|nr:UTP--glucose-1-phosphate uridylyltransferase [Mycena kentingensis (nom. inval.)]